MIVALYARVSTAKQAEKDLSIPDQLRQMRNWCERAGHTVGAEYVEPGASATDDRRPAFQRMIAEACGAPPPFGAVVVHSQSRFFRDLVGFVVYERRLNKAGVKIISITQPTGEDSAGVMLRRLMSLFDEYASSENSKHTLRAMQENARRGFFNGSRPPFGYRTEEVDQAGRKGKKKLLAVDPAEAEIVRKVFAVYLQGEDGHEVGYLGLARTLNARGLTYRGTAWTRNRIEAVLSNPAYVGEYAFNRKHAKTGRMKPKEEWVFYQVPAILEADLFEAAERRRKARHSSQVNPKVVGSRTLLAGLVRCGRCGAGMTLATGKGGRYRYYKCNTRITKGSGCDSGNIPAPRLDRAVREAMCDRVFTPGRVRRILEGLRGRLRRSQGQAEGEVKRLRGELERNRQASERLFDAVEKDLLPRDSALADRAHRLKARREALLAEIASLQRQELMPSKLLAPRNLEAFCQALRSKVLDERSGFARSYLKLLVEEIRVEGETAVMRGSHAALAGAVAEKELGTPGEVPRSVPNWLPSRDSNLRTSNDDRPDGSAGPIPPRWTG